MFTENGHRGALTHSVSHSMSLTTHDLKIGVVCSIGSLIGFDFFFF